MYNLSIETNIISMMMLLTLFISLRKQTNRHEFINRIFIFLLMFNMVLMFFDSLEVVFDGNPTVWGSIILKVSTFVYYFLNPIIPLVWVFYIDYHIFKSSKKLKRIFYTSLPFLLVHLFFIIMSTTGSGYIYYIDSANNYSRGPLLWITIVITYGLVIAATVMVIIFRKRIRKDEVLPLILFALPPAFAAIIQLANPGMTIIWPSVTISLLIVYIYIQSKLTTTDYLTGLFNRREYDNRVIMLNQHKNKNLKMSGIVVDIDNFKVINDTYGHNVGDHTLIYLSQILKDSVRKDDFVARLGGDEFSIMLFNQDQNALNEIVNRIEMNIKAFNATETAPYQINISIGYGEFQSDRFETIEKFFIFLDHKMYEAKQLNKTK